jgi:hypothetical protein
MLDLDNVQLDPTAAWQPEKVYWFNWTKTMVARVEAKKVDITAKLGKDWWLIGAVFAGCFGEPARESFHIVSRLAEGYSAEKTDEQYNSALKKSKFKTTVKFRDILLAHKIDIKYSDPSAKIDVGHFLSNQGFSEEAIMDAKLHGICDKNCQMFSVDAKRDDEGNVTGASTKLIANFTMNIRFLIKDKERPLRIIDISYKTPMGEIVEITLAIPTDELSTRAGFKRFIERHAGITFRGSDLDLEKIKERFFPYEKAATMINVLGWYDRDGVYFFNNGAIYEDRWFECDKDGFVEVDDKVYYIPSANQNNWFRESDFANKRAFVMIDNGAKFEQWAPQFFKVYDKPGMIGMVYFVACMFSDIIFNYCQGFVMPYLHGPPSGGKGSLIKSGQRLWGEPQTPVAIPGKKATDKAKVRKLAQFSNALVLLDEYPEYPVPDTEEGCKLIYDRTGDTRAMKDYSFDTEDVPISSGVMLTSNYMPRNEPLLTRLMVVEVNYEGRKSGDAEKEFIRLQDMERKGISAITRDILHHRAAFKSRFVTEYKKAHADASPVLRSKGIREDRMVKNVSMMLATYNALKEELKFPFSYDDLKNYMVQSMVRQNSRRKTEDKISAFWTVFIKNIKERKLKHGYDFDINGDRLALVWMPTYTEFTSTYKMMYNRTAPARIEMSELLKSSEYYVDSKKSYRFENTEQEGQTHKKERITSAMLFNINELMKSEFDIVFTTQSVHDAGSRQYGEGLTIDAQRDYRIQREKEAVEEERSGEMNSTATVGAETDNKEGTPF